MGAKCYSGGVYILKHICIPSQHQSDTERHWSDTGATPERHRSDTCVAPRRSGVAINVAIKNVAPNAFGATLEQHRSNTRVTLERHTKYNLLIIYLILLDIFLLVVYVIIDF